MKRVLPVLAVVMLLSTTAAFAEDGPQGGPPPGAPPAKEGGPQGGPPGGGDGEGRGERRKLTDEEKKEMFPKMKAERIAKIKEHLACVEKANDFEAMKSCRPKHGMGHGKGGWGKRGGEGNEGRGPRDGGEGRGPGGDDGAPE
ncbi:MAG: hypothetical protein ACAH80_15075 [Alphaproteobacteria bacterium]